MESPKRRLWRPYKRTIKKQLIWNYIRRNRFFRVRDIVLLTEINKNTVKSYLIRLQKHGYVRHVDTDKKDAIYTLLRDTGAKAPTVDTDGLYDYNTGEAHA